MLKHEKKSGGKRKGAGRKPNYQGETKEIGITIPVNEENNVRQLVREYLKKCTVLVLFFVFSLSAIASSYEIVGYSNKGHYKQTFGSALINDSCEIYIVVDDDTYYVKYSPEAHRDRIDGKTQSRATCNGVPCYIATNKGTIETIEIIFESETIKFYVK